MDRLDEVQGHRVAGDGVAVLEESAHEGEQGQDEHPPPDPQPPGGATRAEGDGGGEEQTRETPRSTPVSAFETRVLV